MPAGKVANPQQCGYVKFRDDVVDCLHKRSSQDNFDRSPLTFLLVGETGSGKSAMITLFVNFLHAASVRDLEPVIHQDTEHAGNPAHSGTREVVIYKHNGGPGQEILFVDTPGFNDTRSIDQDGKNRRMVADGMHSLSAIHGVLIIANGTASKITPNQEYVFTQLATIIPHAALNNVFLIATFCPKRSSFKLPMPEIEALLCHKIPEDHIILIDNPIAEWRDIIEDHGAPTQQDFNELEDSFRVIGDKLLKLFLSATKLKPTPTNQFVRLDHSRTQVDKALDSHLHQIQEHSVKQEILRVLEAKLLKETVQEKDLIKAWKEANRWEIPNFTPVEHYNTLCHNPSCKYKFCHERCHLAYTPAKDETVFSHCAVNYEGTCTTCGCTNFTQDHWHGKYEKIYIDAPRKIKAENLEECRQRIGNMQAQVRAIEKKVKECDQHVHSSLGRLQQRLGEFNRAASGSYGKYVQARLACVLRQKDVLRARVARDFLCAQCGNKPFGDPEETVTIWLLACGKHAVCKACADVKVTKRCAECNCPRDQGKEKEVNREYMYDLCPEAENLALLVGLFKKQGNILEKASRANVQNGGEQKLEPEENIPREELREPVVVELN